MQFKLISLAALATLAAATPTRRTGIAPGECNTGPIQCCQSTGTADDKTIAGLLSLVGVVVQDLNVLIGVTCSPITVIGAGGAGCSASPVCCENNSFHGLISIGCVPVNVGL
ncbi:hypothetical protein VNI00_012782 [Paramarasmius palmivorus]|uniref:Hydrophobin n=1 Tax=Paramarasmius palmivorus TaxID=297713 RepID=A0AAW0C3X0_9AGAR